MVNSTCLLIVRNMHTIISANSSFDKALLSVAEGLRTNGMGVSSGKVISCTFLRCILIGFLFGIKINALINNYAELSYHHLECILSLCA